MIEFIILWVFFAQPWSLGPVPMTPGWYAAYSWMSPTSDDLKMCDLAAERAKVLGLKAACLSGEIEPGPIAEPMR